MAADTIAEQHYDDGLDYDAGLVYEPLPATEREEVGDDGDAS